MFSLNFAELGDKNIVIAVIGFESVGDQDATTVPARRMRETTS